MKALFADSFYFFAVVNRGDPAHAKALALSASFKGRLVTTAWALTEFADGMSRPVANRPLFLQILADLRLGRTRLLFRQQTSCFRTASTSIRSARTRNGR